jgi:hypothetical protein
MSKTVTLIAKAFLTYQGRGYGNNMQFAAPEQDAKRFLNSGEAVLAPVKKVAAVAPVEPVVEPPKVEVEVTRARRFTKE